MMMPTMGSGSSITGGAATSGDAKGSSNSGAINFGAVNTGGAGGINNTFLIIGVLVVAALWILKK